MTPFDAFDLSAEDLARLPKDIDASYWLVSSDGRISSFSKPYWGAPSTPTEILGMYAEPSARGYALVGPRSWLSFGPEAPAEPPWLDSGEVRRIQGGPGGCWALFVDGIIRSPDGRHFEPEAEGNYVDFAIGEKGVIWLDANGALSGAETRARSAEAEAIGVSVTEDQVLVVYKNGWVSAPNGSLDKSLANYLLSEIVSVASSGDGLWLVTANGVVYGWGNAQHGGNLHAPRDKESIVALCV